MPATPSEEHRSHDVIVVGNGSPGLSLGLTPVRRGIRVAVLGRPHRPGAASTAAGAVIGAFGEFTTTLPGNEHGRTKPDRAHEPGKSWPERPARLSPDSAGTDLPTADGTVVILNTVGLPEIDTQSVKAIRNSLIEYDEEFGDTEGHHDQEDRPRCTTTLRKALA